MHLAVGDLILPESGTLANYQQLRTAKYIAPITKNRLTVLDVKHRKTGRNIVKANVPSQRCPEAPRRL